jgi:hypothetical protein
MKSIIIKLVNGKKYIFDINEDTIYKTVKTLKYSIEKNLDIKIGMQRLLYNGSPISNDFMLINLPNNCIINLILQLETISE